jgi:MFS family permease
MSKYIHSMYPIFFRRTKSMQVLPANPEPWWKIPHLLTLNGYIACLILFSGTTGYDISLMNGLQSLDQWQIFMHQPTGAWLGFISALQSLGGMVFAPVGAWSANRLGRKRTVLFGYFWLALGVGLQVGARNAKMFIASRIFVGIAGAWFQAAVILVTEIAYPSHRSLVTAMFMCQYYAGSLLSAWIVFGTRNMESDWAWRIPSLMQIALPLLALPGTLLVPESPRWLIRQKRTDEARNILVRLHAGGEESSELVAFEMNEITRSIMLEQNTSEESRWIDCVTTPGNRYRLFLTVSLGFFAQWNGG